jgi:hypothetical protein
MIHDDPNQDPYREYFIGQIKEWPKDASAREQSIVRSLAITYARRELLELTFRKYERAREREVNRWEEGVTTDEEVRDALDRAEEATSRFAPGYRVRLEFGPLLKDPDKRP